MGDDRRDLALVLGAVALLAAPPLLLGPSIMADDWVWLRNAEFLDWWDAGGDRQVGRPGAYALYALVYGAVGAHPLVHALVQVALWAAAAGLLLAALRELVGRGVAVVAALVWVLAPTHTTLELWSSTSQAHVAVALLAAGALVTSRATRASRGRWVGLCLLGAAGAFYEVAVPAVPVVAAAVDLARVGRVRGPTVAFGVATAVPAAVWALVSASVYSSALRTTEDEWVIHLAGSVGMGVPVERRAVAGLLVVAWLVAVLPAARRAARRQATGADAAALVGAALTVAGTLPALRSYSVPIGMGDRLTAVSGIGAALTWVAVLSPHARRLSPTVLRAAAVAAVAVAVAARVPAWREWDDLGEESARAVAALAAEAGGGDRPVLVVPGPLVENQWRYGLSDGWNATAAVQVVADDPTVVVQVDVRCFRTGPLADEPLEQYGQRVETPIPGCVRERDR